jgi:hypothetical protein
MYGVISCYFTIHNAYGPPWRIPNHRPFHGEKICPFLLLIFGDGDWVELQNPTVKTQTSKIPFNVRHNLQINHRCYCGWLRNPAPSTPAKRWLTVKRVAMSRDRTRRSAQINGILWYIYIYNYRYGIDITCDNYRYITV